MVRLAPLVQRFRVLFYFMLKIHFFLWTNEKDDVIFKQILFGEGDLIKCPQLP